jgi:hypothetical protein
MRHANVMSVCHAACKVLDNFVANGAQQLSQHPRQFVEASLRCVLVARDTKNIDDDGICMAMISLRLR